MDALDDIFGADFKETPYWWEAAPRPRLEPASLPAKVDVAVIGCGLTGLNAAIELARAGRSVCVFDIGDPGAGASSRNAGFVGRVLKHEFSTLISRFGLPRAKAFYEEMQDAFDAVSEVIVREAIQCHYRVCGRFVMASSQRQYDELGRELELKKKHLGQDFELVPRAELRREVATESFVGGAVIPDLAALHPGLYHLGLLEASVKAGVQVIPNTEVESVERTGAAGPFRLGTARGSVLARDVFAATNGYTGRATRSIQRRLIPFDAYMIATEELPEETVREILPTGRTYLDANFNIDFLRPSPDGRRILFGGSTGMKAASLRTVASRLRNSAAALLPGLREVRVSHVWTGRCAATFDMYPHTGVIDGIHYAAGYCFAGIPMGTYLGRKAAWRILGRPEARTVFSERNFPTIPFYGGNPWFVPYAMAFLTWRERRANHSNIDVRKIG